MFETFYRGLMTFTIAMTILILVLFCLAPEGAPK